MSGDHDANNRLEWDSNFICPAADKEDKNASSQHLIEESNSSPQIEHQQLQSHPDDISSYNIETMRHMIFDMMQDLDNNMTDTITNTQSSFSNHRKSPALHPNIGGDHELLVRHVSKRHTLLIPLFIECNGKNSSMIDEGDDNVLSAGHSSMVHADAGYEVTSVDLRQMVYHICSSSPDQFVNHFLQEGHQHHREANFLSIPLFIEVVNNKDSSMIDKGNDDDDVLSAGHSSVVHADAGYEVTSVDLQQMVYHICSSSPDQFVNHCLQEGQHHRESKMEVCTSFSMTLNNKAMMQSRRLRRVSDQMTMHCTSYTTNPKSNLCLPCSDPNSVALLKEIEPLQFR